MTAARRVPWAAALLAAIAAVAAAAGPAAALVPPQDGQASYEMPLQPFDLFSYQSPATAADRAQVEAALVRTYGGTWAVYSWNPQTRTPSEMFGSGVVVSGPLRSPEDARAAAEQVILSNADVLRADLGGLRFKEATSAPPVTNAPDGRNRPGKWAAHFQQVYRGREVIGGEVHVIFTDAGRLFALGSTYYPGIAVDANPSIPAEQAKEIARRALPFHPQTDSVEPGAPLEILPVPRSGTQVDYHLVWRVRVRTREPLGTWLTSVDARTGEILARTNEVCFDFLGTAVGQVERFGYCDGSGQEAMPYVSVKVNHDSVSADDYGNWSVVSGNPTGELTSRLTSPYVSVHNAGGPDALVTAAVQAGVPYQVNYTDSNSLASERDVFRTINDVHDFFETFAPGWAFTNARIDAWVNIHAACNAYWDSTGIHFFRSDPSCADTGRMMDVVAHEYGHGVQNAILGQQGDQGLGEGNGDALGNLMTGQSVIGLGFHLNCSQGLRDSHNTLKYPNDVIGHEIHDAGRVIAGFHWDALQDQILHYGHAWGRWNAAYDWFWGRVLVQPTTQPDQVFATFVANDDDGDLTDGTPQYDSYCTAAANHGFQCPAARFPMHDGICAAYYLSPQSFRIDQENPYWAAVAVNPAPGDDKDMYLYSDDGTVLLASSIGRQGTDFVVGDFNHNPFGPYQPVVTYGGATTPFVVDWAGGRHLITLGSDISGTVGGWDPGCGLVQAWDVFMQAGKTYRFYLWNTGGDADIRVSLFRNPSARPYWVGRDGSEFELQPGAPQEYTAPADDYYGVVVFNNSPGSPDGSFTLRVQEAPVALASAACQGWQTSPRMFRFDQESAFWTAVAVNPSGADDKDIGVYSDPDGAQGPLALSTGTQGTDFVVGDFNHNAYGTYYPRVSYGDVTAPYVVEWNGSDGGLLVGQDQTGSVGGGNGACGLIQIWDIFLVQGQTYRFLVTAMGQADIRMSLFRNPASAPYWAPRNASEFEAGNENGVSYTTPATDWYGVVVFNNSPGSPGGIYSLQIRYAPASLASATCVTGAFVPQVYSFAQSTNYWTCVGVNPVPGDDKDMYVYDNMDCLGNALGQSIGTQGTDYVVGDFNHNPQGTYYALASYGNPSSSYVVDWDDGPDLLSVGSVVQGSVGGGSGACGLVKIWDVYLNAGKQYRIALDKTGAADVRISLFRNPTNQTYWAGRADAVFEQQAGTPVNYTAPAADYYGLVVFNASPGSPSGTYTLHLDAVSGVDEIADARAELSFPNPYPVGSPITVRAAAEGTPAAVHLYNVQGRLVRTLLEEPTGRAPRLLHWDGRTDAGGTVGAGIYFVRAEIGQLHWKKSLLLLR